MMLKFWDDDDVEVLGIVKKMWWDVGNRKKDVVGFWES